MFSGHAGRPPEAERRRRLRIRPARRTPLGKSSWSWVVVLSLCSACDALSRDYDVWVDTLSTGLVRVYNQDLLRSSREPDFVLVEDLRLGRASGLGRTPDGATSDGPEDFGRIVGLAVDGHGRIYVADQTRHEIRVFDPAGSLLRTVGRHGVGPGEFQELGGVVWHPSGVLLAMDVGTRKVTVFDSLGAVLSVAGHHDQADSLEAPWRIETDTLGFLHERDPDSPSWAGSVFKHRIVDDFTLATVDTIALPERGPRFDSIPTNWRPLWAVDPDGSVWHGNTNRFRFFKVTDRSDTTLAVELRRPTPRLEGRVKETAWVPHGDCRPVRSPGTRRSWIHSTSRVTDGSGPGIRTCTRRRGGGRCSTAKATTWARWLRPSCCPHRRRRFSDMGQSPASPRTTAESNTSFACECLKWTDRLPARLQPPSSPRCVSGRRCGPPSHP